MLTVKHIHEHGETIYAAERVTRIFSDKGGDAPGLLIDVNDGRHSIHLNHGNCYVMNGAGKTIDHYTLTLPAPIAPPVAA